jgi:hypothetical protein
MIAFDLECSHGHTFEGWFSDIDSFDDQNSKDLVSCPMCNDTNVRRIPSPVAFRSGSRPADSAETLIDHHKLAKEMVDYINNNFEDVGTEFTKEALKMHYGIKEKRNIRGAATEEEEKTLKEEGIEYFKFPAQKKKESV